MPPKCKFTRGQVVQAALDITREQGIEAVTARSVGARLNSSPKVIFSLFRNMEELTAEVLGAAHSLYQEFLTRDMASGQYPPYKGSGMGYIRFAKEEQQLFRLLFMRDRTHEPVTDGKEEMRPILALIEQNTGLCAEDAYLFHLEMWLYVHGIAVMIATSYLDWEMEFVSRVLTDAYLGLKARFGAGKSGDGCAEGTNGQTGNGRGDGSEDEATNSHEAVTESGTGSGRAGGSEKMHAGGPEEVRRDSREREAKTKGGAQDGRDQNNSTDEAVSRTDRR